MANFTILEPMSIGDVIDRAVRLYRRNFAPLLAIVAVPGFVGYLASTMFWFGYTKMVLGAGPEGFEPPTVFSITMLILGGLFYPLWLFLLLFTTSGMARVIGDHVMVGESLTFRNCFRAARKRLGDIVLMALLYLVILFVIYFIFSILFFVILLVTAFLLGITATAGLPPWLAATITGILAIAVILLAIAAGLVVVARVIFLPQVVMIEGQSAGQALGRAMELGKKNWHKVGAIVLFTYFVSLSLLAALTLPVLAFIYTTGVLDAEFFVSPTWNVIYMSFSQLSNLLTLPIWMIAFTLLYFDSRVRKEAYDIELLAREVNPGFYWQPQYQTVMGYQTPAVSGYNSGYNRSYVQTSPLGLGGWRPPPDVPPGAGVPSVDAMSVPAAASVPEPSAAPPISTPLAASGLAATESEWREAKAASATMGCRTCATPLEPGALFCIRCGAAVRETDGQGSL